MLDVTRSLEVFDESKAKIVKGVNLKYVGKLNEEEFVAVFSSPDYKEKILKVNINSGYYYLDNIVVACFKIINSPNEEPHTFETIPEIAFKAKRTDGSGPYRVDCYPYGVLISTAAENVSYPHTNTISYQTLFEKYTYPDGSKISIKG